MVCPGLQLGQARYLGLNQGRVGGLVLRVSELRGLYHLQVGRYSDDVQDCSSAAQRRKT